ncbi:MAG: sulfatase [Verrucomicrobiales bacterium]|nr:sulfatase [Verrucomicrobiales bacterium]
MKHKIVSPTVLFALSAIFFPLAAAETGKPNVVFIFIDDMGYGDIGPFGSTKNKTPNLDRMAAEGMKLTDFYVSATACTPSRAALMTGCYADRISMDGRVCFPGEARGLNPEETTIAEMLKAQGYATGCFGKWHLGDMPQLMPLNHGFDEYEGIPYSNDMWVHLQKRDFPPLPWMKQDKAVAHIPDAPSQALLIDAITNATVDFIKRKKDEAFFVYMPHAAVHLPRLVKKEEGDRADGDATRAQVEAVDASVGRVLETLRELGIAENTLVFFTSDNGPAAGLSPAPLRGGKGGPRYEGNMRMPTLAWWPGKIPAGSVCSEIGRSIDIFPTLAKLCGGEVPTDRIIDGKDISSLLTNPDAKSPHSELYYEYEGIRQGNWKLVKIRKASRLFDLATDIGEQTDIAAKHPEKVAELEKLLVEHKAKVTSARRPAGAVANAKPILTEPGDLPSLAEYMGEANLKTVGTIYKTPPKKK